MRGELVAFPSEEAQCGGDVALVYQQIEIGKRPQRRIGIECFRDRRTFERNGLYTRRLEAVQEKRAAGR